MFVIRLPNGNLKVPYTATDGRIIGDVYVEVGPQDADYARLAEQSGFDEALLTGPDGLISEGSTTNIGFFDGTSVVWPAAAMLAGVTMQLVAARLALPQRHSAVRVADLGTFEAVFITNSHGVAAVTEVDHRQLPVDTAFIATLKGGYESVPWDEI